MNSAPQIARMRGLSLIELLISMAIGLIVVGALVALYSGTTGTTAVAKAQNEMNEDAQYVLRLLGNQIRQAGYNPIHADRTTVNPMPPLPPAAPPESLAIFACTNGFANPLLAADATALTCKAAPTDAGHALVLAYEADTHNTKPTAGGVPTNCLGNSLQQQEVLEGATFHQYYIAENRFYVKNNQLYCAGTAANIGEQPLADNVERMEVRLGMAYPVDLTINRSLDDNAAPTSAEMTALLGREAKNGDIVSVSYNRAAAAKVQNHLYKDGWIATNHRSNFAAGYLSPTEVGPASGPDTTGVNDNLLALSAAQRWGKVVSVRLCIIMRSDKEVLSEITPYYGCDVSAAALTIPTDRYLRRAYVTTIALRNRMGLPP